jgi:hypothetical protein
MSYFKFQMFASLTHGFEEAAKQQGAAAAGELDEIKRMLIETNPWFLGITALVSVLHVMYVFRTLGRSYARYRSLKFRDVGFQVRCVSLA